MSISDSKTVKQVAIVTGVSRGLGEFLAAALLDRGYDVIGIGRSSAARLAGRRYAFVHCDFADIAGIDSALEPSFRSIAASGPRSVCLINNAATAEPVGVLGALDASEIAHSLGVNLVGPVVVANLFCRVFTDEATERRIINVSSGAAQSGIAGGGTYSIAKAGLEMLTKQLVADLRTPTLRAITVRPGIIDTGMQVLMRTQPDAVLPSAAMFREFHESGQLVAPAEAAAKIVAKLVLADVEQGRTYTYKEL